MEIQNLACFEEFLDEAFDMKLTDVELESEMTSGCEITIHIMFQNVSFEVVIDIDDLAYDYGLSNKDYCNYVSKLFSLKWQLVNENFSKIRYEPANAKLRTDYINEFKNIVNGR